jgi:hypothetical protein
MLAVGAIISYFLWPVAALVAVVMMKAPGAGVKQIFWINRELY